MSLRLAPGLDELVTADLFAQGAAGSAEMEGRLLFYFPEQSDLENIAQDLQKLLAQLRAGGASFPDIIITQEKLEAQDWQSAWKQYFKPMLISERVLVRPSWETASIAPGQIEIIIDPKQAFGTGHHATTRSMVRTLEKYLRPGMCVIDVGTGTGILAIAVAKLQPNVRVVALDTDPVAVDAAQENICLNHVTDCVKLYAGPVATLQTQPVDLILANLQYQPLVELLADLAQRLKAKGVLLLSGLLAHEGESIQKNLEHAGMRCIEIRKEEEWLTLAATPGLAVWPP